jgi:hypothetical protein
VSGWLFSFLVVLVLVSTAAVSVYLSGLHANRITLNDPSARSVAVATDLDAYRALLWAQPSPTWRSYYSRHLNDQDSNPIFKGDIRAVRQVLDSGRIIELPNGTRGEEEEEIVLTMPDSPSRRTSLEAIKVRVRTGPRKGLEAWTSPDLFQHDGPPPLP